MAETVKWPSIRATMSDKGIMDAIKASSGKLKGMNQKELMLMAAAFAVEKGLPYDPIDKSQLSDSISYSNLNRPDYQEYRHYISAIYFMTKAEKKVDNMKDVNDMAKNFEDYAHRGILYLKDKYLDAKEGDNELFVDFINCIGSKTK